MSDDQRMPPPGSALAQQPGGGPVRPTVLLPSGGVFAQSEAMVAIKAARDEMWRCRTEWIECRDRRDHTKAEARKVRANLLVRLRVFGNEATNDLPMKTAVERNEWADADADVQRAELEMDLAQSAAMSAFQAYQDAQALFGTLQGILGIERDEIKMARRGE